MGNKVAIKTYNGFGHTHDVTLFGHVFTHVTKYKASGSHSWFGNMLAIFRMFFIKPVKGAPLTLRWNGQEFSTESEADGFFRFEWMSDQDMDAGWHSVQVSTPGALPVEGQFFVPHITQFAFISDVDDTAMISHSATKFKRLRELLFPGAAGRKMFKDAARHYQLLSLSFTKVHEPNPFFYVSSSEWNLYDYLSDIFTINKMPAGTFLLSQAKRWYELVKTGKTKHNAKLLRIIRVFDVFPNQRFVLIGDNTQHDPAIYASVVEKYGDRVYAVYIRNIHASNQSWTAGILDRLAARGIHTCLFKQSVEAIQHSISIGLVDASLFAAPRL